ncbi:MAG TPA: hypothetical protein VFG36_06180 [Methanoregula sp.]|nr:hypothetical protein [Methanoregula sp.]
MRSNIATLRRPKAGGDVVWVAAGTGGGIFQHPPWEASGIKRNYPEQKKREKFPARCSKIVDEIKIGNETDIALYFDK